MATLNGSEYANAYVDEPGGKNLPHILNGRIRRAYGSYTFLAEASVGDIYNLIKLPANAVIIEAKCIFPDSGATGTFDVGWAASEEGNEAVDINGVFAALDSGSAAIDADMARTLPAFNKRFSEEVVLQAEFSAVTTTATGNKLELEIRYIID